MASEVKYQPIVVNVGSPTLTVNFYTRYKSYELHSKIGDPNTAILSVSTTKELISPAGSFTISLVPESDSNGETWKDKLEVFDYVEIYIKGGATGETEKIIMRGLIDGISTDEDYSDDVPQRSITVSGRDLGALFSDLSVWYSPLLDPVAAIAKMASWRKSRDPYYTIETLFAEYINYMTSMLELTVGKPTYVPEDLRKKQNPEDTKTGVVVSPPTTINLASKIQSKIKGFFPGLITMFAGQMETTEGAWWNLFQNYQDKPFHEMFIWDDVDASRFIVRPGRLYDMKKNYHQNVKAAMDEMGKEAYPSDFSISNEDKISTSVRQSISQMYNNFFTYPEVGGMAKIDFLPLAVLDFQDNPSESVNPFYSLRPKQSAAGVERDVNGNITKGDEPMAYIGRYGLRPYEVTIHFFELDLGQFKQADTKDPDAQEKPQQTTSKWRPLSSNPIEQIGPNRYKINRGVGRYEDLVEKNCQATNADKAMVYAIMDKGSGGDQYKTTNHYYVGYFATPPGPVRSTDVGLMQINDKDNPSYTGGTDPDRNINYGSTRASRLQQKYAGQPDATRKALAAYKDEAVVDNAITRASAGGDWFTFLPVAAAPYDGTEIQKWADETLSLYTEYDQKVRNLTPYTGSPDVKQARAEEGASYSRSAMDLLKDPYKGPSLKYNFILVCWYLHNHYLFDGTMTIRGTNKAIIGTYVNDSESEYFDLNGGLHKGMEYYVEAVSHNFQVFTQYTTTLTITRGQPYKGGLFGQGYRGKWYFDEGVIPVSFQQKSYSPAPPTKVPAPTPTQPSPSPGFVRLPDETPTCGYYYYGDADKRWGKPETIEAIKAAGLNWQSTHPYPTYSRLGIGDISIQNGNYATPCPGHPKGHRVGNEFDLRAQRLDGKEDRCSLLEPATLYDKTLTEEAVSVVSGNGIRSVRVILFGDATCRGINYDKSPPSSHYHHLHVGFKT